VRRLRDLTGSEDPDIEGAAGQNDRSFGDVGGYSLMVRG
jgi:hypothetical protein